MNLISFCPQLKPCILPLHIPYCFVFHPRVVVLSNNTYVVMEWGVSYVLRRKMSFVISHAKFETSLSGPPSVENHLSGIEFIFHLLICHAKTRHLL